MVDFTYSGWKVNHITSIASRLLPPHDEVITVNLQNKNDRVAYEGWWPEPIETKKTVMLTGACLWDGRWQLEFEHVNKSNPPSRLSLGLHAERGRIIEKIKKQKRVAKIYYPKDLGDYHKTLVSWQASKVKEFKPNSIIYHLPLSEYHEYINSLEECSSLNLNILHSELNEFYLKIRNHIEKSFEFVVVEKINFISPYDHGITNPIDSYIFPYQNPEIFGVRREELFGVEDFSEIRLSYSAWKRGNQDHLPIPVLGGIIGDRSYYYGNKTLVGTGVMKFSPDPIP